MERIWSDYAENMQRIRREYGENVKRMWRKCGEDIYWENMERIWREYVENLERICREYVENIEANIEAEYSLFCRALLQKRPIIVRSLRMVATPYVIEKRIPILWHSILTHFVYMHMCKWVCAWLRHTKIKNKSASIHCQILVYIALWGGYC